MSTRTDQRRPLSAATAPVWRRTAAPRSVAFWLVAYVFAANMLGTTLPTPLYVVYQGQWHFAAGVVTLIFASYAAGVLAALLLAGRSSDQIGRRPVLATALGLGLVSTLVFILAPSVAWLFVGRVLSGMSAGLMTGTATAALTDLVDRSGRARASRVATIVNTGGLGLGPLVAGVFAEYGPAPTVLVFEVFLAFLVVAGVALALTPETVTARQRLDLRYRGLAIPADGRAEFIAAGAAGFVSFALLGLFTSLVPGFLGGVLHEHSHLLAGFVVFLAFAVSAGTQLVASFYPSQLAMQYGLAVMLAAFGLLVAALSLASLALFLVATVAGGLAAGAAFVGSLSIANGLAPSEIRGQVVSTYFIFSYVGLTIPVIGVGFGSQYFGDFRAVLVGSIVLGGLSVAAAIGARRACPARARD